ncbi:MAG: chloramphenicol acetyltransferase [Saprospiraceae bacterium]|nr:chloramphenicol acetyltransferase [Saprospiraceae bacterium]MCF8251700.1 chloramphenicol acetyltransferase [Saprospiraceae bacterium]MCF8281082.1 chloramphenicol acetyltransferase [Bacteroidales bacterium]MCF8311754.1 chloramphenicol acetyltransferase [Saprospiraceae bacterium]MCF8441796.1 chloramphenicol acetyltransferase [Saprospiraceae bacterium]
MYKTLDTTTWKRREVFHFFRKFDDPFFNITANVDVALLFDFCKKNKLSFSLASLHCSTLAANAVEEFRMRLVGGEVRTYDIVHPSLTVLHDDETFSFCYLDMQPDLRRFVADGRGKIEEQLRTRHLEPGDDEHDKLHYSIMPWVSFTGIKHARRFGREDSVPKIVFGKILEENGGKKMPVSVEANHALMDGLHVGKYFQFFQEQLEFVDL